MPLTTAAIVTASAKALNPIITDLYKGSKGKIQNELSNWSNARTAKKTAKTIAKFEMIKTLWSPDKEVSIHDFYYPSKLDDDIKSKKVDSVDDLPRGNVVVQGIVGQGKSIFMRYLASTALKNPSRASLPLFLELRTLTSKLGLKQSIFQILKAMDLDISEESFAYLACSGRLLLLLDGFDEIADELVRDVLNDIEILETNYPELRFIVSSRPGNEIQKIASFSVVKLSPLTNKDYLPFLVKLGIDTQKRTELVRAISESPSHISGIIRTPLMMTLVVMVYESEREIPPTLPEFFERLFQVVFTRHDRLKAGFYRKHYSGLSERRLQLLFEAFCFMTLQSGYGRTLTSEQFANVFELAIEYTDNCQCEMEKFRLDITKVSCLMLDEGIDLTTFLHKSILEYYAAAFIKHSLPEVANLFYPSTINNFKQWQEVLSFLREIDPYNYSKEYILEEAVPLFEEVTALLKLHETPNLISFINKYQPEIYTSFRKSENGTIEVIYFSGMKLPTSYSLSNFSNLIVGAMHQSIPVPLSHQMFAEMIPYQPLHSEKGIVDEIHVNFKSIINHFGAKEFWIAINQFEQQLVSEISRAKSIIDTEEKRKLIFKRNK